MTVQSLLRLGSIAALLAGLLRIASSFLPYAEASAAHELLYLTIDLCILFGLLAIYFCQYLELGRTGVVGFGLALAGAAIIVGPDGSIGAIPMYPLGSLLLLLGLTIMAIAGWRAARLPRWALASWPASLLLGLATTIPGAPAEVFVLAGVTFGVGFLGAGLRLWSVSSSA